jgi:hypothetical protein
MLQAQPADQQRDCAGWTPDYDIGYAGDIDDPLRQPGSLEIFFSMVLTSSTTTSGNGTPPPNSMRSQNFSSWPAAAWRLAPPGRLPVAA